MVCVTIERTEEQISDPVFEFNVNSSFSPRNMCKLYIVNEYSGEREDRER